MSETIFVRKIRAPRLTDGAMVEIAYTDMGKQEDGAFLSVFEFDGKRVESRYAEADAASAEQPVHARLMADAAMMEKEGIHLTRAELAVPETARTDFSATAAALEKFDKDFDALSAQLVASQRAQVRDRIVREIQEAADKVSHAFWLDTQAVNTLGVCMKLRPGLKNPPPGERTSFIRSCVATWKAEQEALPS